MEPISFADWLFEEGRSSKTIASYTSDVRGFQSYLVKMNGEKTSTLSRFSFVKYKDHLIAEGFAISTINKKINSLKVYNDYLIKQGVLENVVIDMKRDQIKVAAGSHHQVDILSDDEVEKLLFYLEDTHIVSQRNKLIVYLLLYTGVRVSELVGIQRDQIDPLTKILTVYGKNGKVREVSLREDVLKILQAYEKGERRQSKFQESSYLLVSQRSPHMHRDAVRDWLAIVSKKLGFKIHPHLFRHTFCTRLLRKGVDLTTVSMLAGHSSVNMTARFYIQTTREEKQDAVNLL